MERAATPLKVRINDGATVSALLRVPANVNACFVFAHGAGAGMSHSFMEAVAEGLAARGIATLRYQFPYMDKGSKRPDKPEIAHATVRAAVAEAAQRLHGIRLIAGGKSFGARMTSQAQAAHPLPGVVGLAFFAFPLHPAGKPSIDRAGHLGAISIPMLFLQGANDKLAEVSLLEPVVSKLGAKATLHLVNDADHGFHVPKRSGRTDDDVLNDILEVFAGWSAIVPDKTQR